MVQTPRNRVIGASIAAAVALAVPFAMDGATAKDRGTTSAETVQVLRVNTASRADRNVLSALGLDVGHAVGPGWTDVVVHTAAERATLRNAGFTWTVRVADVKADERQRIADDRAFAASLKGAGSGLPSGRSAYRLLADYGTELDALAAANPSRARTFTLNHASLEGRTIKGIEISDGVTSTSDGKPTLLVMGVHHAREWPSGELSMEFAHDLLKNSSDPRIANVLANARVVVVPVVNPDGFNVSRTLAYEMKRKNCRMVDGQLPVAGACAQSANSTKGTDPNRNYGGYWGGPGASTSTTSETYRGTGAFSEPETQNIRELVSGKQVTTLITNHTYSNLVLRQPGLASLGVTPDEGIYKALGDAMAAQMGYTSQYGYQLYDTTGTTEDWSYSATGGLGFTFEHGASSFHPRFSNVVDMYTGGRKLPGKGARGAFLLAAENTIDASKHSVITGTATPGATLKLTKSFNTKQWSGTIPDTLTTTLTVPASGTFTWHVNPSTRPEVVTAGGTEAWKLSCNNGATQDVTVARGASVTVSPTC